MMIEFMYGQILVEREMSGHSRHDFSEAFFISSFTIYHHVVQSKTAKYNKSQPYRAIL